MSTPNESLTEIVERELAELRESGIVNKEAPTITRSTFELLSAQEKKDFLLVHKGRTVDDPVPEHKSRTAQPLPKGTIRRSTFDAMPQQVRGDFFRNGGRVVDDEEVSGPSPSGKTLTRAEYREMRMTDQIIFLDGGGQIVD